MWNGEPIGRQTRINTHRERLTEKHTDRDTEAAKQTESHTRHEEMHVKSTNKQKQINKLWLKHSVWSIPVFGENLSTTWYYLIQNVATELDKNAATSITGTWVK